MQNVITVPGKLLDGMSGSHETRPRTTGKAGPGRSARERHSAGMAREGQ